MKRTILCVLLAAGGLAKDAETFARPMCSAAIRGRYWPESANSDARAARKLAQCGELDVCTRTVWRYKWESVTVNVRQLGKTPQDPTPACVAVMAEFGPKSRPSGDATTTSR